MYILNKGIAFVEEDNWEKGCLPGTGFIKDIDVTFKNETKDGIIEDVLNFYGTTKENIELNACDEDGRIDVQVLENGDGESATDYEIEQWKQGKIKLFLVIYTHKLQKIEDVTF